MQCAGKEPVPPYHPHHSHCIIITRKRVKQSLERVMTEPCPYCSGTGTIKNTSTICYEILAEVKKIGTDLNGQQLLLRVNPEIARALKEEESDVMKDLKASLGKDVTVKPDFLVIRNQPRGPTPATDNRNALFALVAAGVPAVNSLQSCVLDLERASMVGEMLRLQRLAPSPAHFPVIPISFYSHCMRMPMT